MSDDFYSTARLEEDLDASIAERKTQERIASLEARLRDVTAALQFYADRAIYLRTVLDPAHPREPFCPAEIDAGDTARAALERVEGRE